MRKRKSGVYLITNRLNGKVYIGSSYILGIRITQHKVALRANRHKNKHLQAAWNKYGETAFAFKVIEYCSSTKCLQREQFYLVKYQAYNREYGYNIVEKAGTTKGRKLSEETKQKLRVINTGKKLTSESIEKCRLAATGVKKSKANRLGISKRFKELWADPEWRQARRRVYKPHTREAKLKMARGNRGRIHTDEARKNMSKFQKGRPKSEAHRLAIKNALKEKYKYGRLPNGKPKSSSDNYLASGDRVGLENISNLYPELTTNAD